MRNSAYDDPIFYDALTAARKATVPELVRTAVAKFATRRPATLIDIGCGTAIYLSEVRSFIPDCTGVDLNPDMLERAKAANPGVSFELGDMRSFRLGRTCDIVLSVGSSITYALEDADLDATLDTYSAHMDGESILIVSCWNAAAFLGSDRHILAVETVRTPLGNLQATSEFNFDRARQRLTRLRKWSGSGAPVEPDYWEYRMLFPQELRHRMRGAGMDVIGVYDNDAMVPSELGGIRMITVARLDGDRNTRSPRSRTT